MRKKILFLTLTLILFSGGSGAVTTVSNCSGHWVGSCMFSRVDAYVAQHSGGKIEGVVYVSAPLGGKTTYHFKGTFTDGVLVASHHSGHMFIGKMVSEDEVAGKITTASKKHTFSLDATREELNINKSGQ